MCIFIMKYNTLFPLPANPDSPPEGFWRWQESLLGGGAQQTVPSHLPYLWKAGGSSSQSGETLGAGPEFRSGPGLDPLKIVFDLFHVVAQFSRIVDKVRNSEYRKASQANKAVFKGAKYLLLRNRANIRRLKDRQHLEELLRLNKVINVVLVLKDKLKPIWTYRSRRWADEAISEWCALARAVNHPAVKKFAKTLCRYRYGILNHCDYPIHTGRLEGVNNKIKVIKQKAYGFHDLRYFSLKVIQAFAN